MVRSFGDGNSMNDLEEKFQEFELVNSFTVMCGKLNGKQKTYKILINSRKA